MDQGSFQLNLFLAGAPWAALLCLGSLVPILTHPQARRLGPLAFLLGLSAAILAFNTLEVLQRTLDAAQFWSRLTYPCIAFCPVAWFLTVLGWTKPKDDRRLLAGLLAIVPALTTVLFWTNGFHHLVWRASDFRQVEGFWLQVVLGYGPWFWVHLVYSYSLYLLGAALLILVPFWGRPLHRIQAVLLVVGGCLPVLVNLVYVFRWLPGTPKDLSPLGVASAAVIFGLAVWKFGLLEVQPGAPGRIVDQAEGPLAVVDDRGQIRDLNDPARRWLGLPPRGILGSPWPHPLAGPSGERTIQGPEGPTVLRWSPLPSTGERRLTLVQLFPAQLASGGPELSRRERTLLEYLGQGLTNKEIGDRLGISENTVKTHVHHILKKTGVRTRNDLLRPKADQASP